MLVVAVIALNAPDGNDKTAAGRSTGAAPTTSRPATASSSPSSSPTKRPSPTPGGPTLSLGNSSDGSDQADKSVPLVVLNNTTTNGLATDAARQFREGGWKVDEIGNLQNEIISTCAYYDPDVRGAEKAAKALQRQFPAIKRVVEKFDGLPSGPIVVVLTPDYANG